jgi:hypothetical protein
MLIDIEGRAEKSPASFLSCEVDSFLFRRRRESQRFAHWNDRNPMKKLRADIFDKVDLGFQ